MPSLLCSLRASAAASSRRPCAIVLLQRRLCLAVPCSSLSHVAIAPPPLLCLCLPSFSRCLSLSSVVSIIAIIASAFARRRRRDSAAAFHCCCCCSLLYACLCSGATSPRQPRAQRNLHQGTGSISSGLDMCCAFELLCSRAGCISCLLAQQSLHVQSLHALSLLVVFDVFRTCSSLSLFNLAIVLL